MINRGGLRVASFCNQLKLSHSQMKRVLLISFSLFIDNKTRTFLCDFTIASNIIEGFSEGLKSFSEIVR